jgi:membrane fusion protein (multidrug efflux system)
MAGFLKQVVVLALLAAGGYGGFAAYQHYFAVADDGGGGGRGRPAPVVEVAAAQTATIERAVSAVGSGRAVRSVDLQLLAGGRVEAMNFAGGEAVEAGQVLLRLNEEAARAALSEARADLIEAEGALQRTMTLREQGRVAEAALEAVQAEVARTQARVLRAENDLDNRRLVAPFEGTIGFTDVEIGSSVGPDTVVATLDDLSQLVIEFSVPERFFGDVTEGALVRAESQIYPGESFDGVVTGVGRRLDVVSRTFEVRALIDNSGQRLPAGAFLRVELVFDERDGVVLPEEAIVSQADSSHVFVVLDGKALRREVRLGMRRVGEVEILEGVAAGEQVIVRGVQKVRDGQDVRLPEARPAGGRDGAPTS